jgi:hypothetical protein
MFRGIFLCDCSLCMLDLLSIINRLPVYVDIAGYFQVWPRLFPITDRSSFAAEGNMPRQYSAKFLL